jgi:hypothetical protein
MQLAIQKILCREILTENYGMRRVAAKSVARLLTDEQKPSDT